jgi:phage virion morphogenesis protein
VADIRFNWKDSGVVRALRGWQRQWISTERTLKIVGQYVAEVGKQSFDKQARPEGGPWKRLNPKYAAWKAEHGYSPSALIKTKQLKNSIAYSIRPTGIKPSVFIGPAAHHGIYHQHGTKHIPARPFMGLGQQHERQIRTIVSNWVRGVTR